MSTALFDIAGRTTVTDKTVQQIVDLILREGLRPGDKLPSVRELMQRLGVGRSSVREAVRTLVAAGIVEVSMGEGMSVCRGDTSILTWPLSWGLLMSDHATREVIEARQTVEVDLAGMAAERGTEEEIATIGRWLDAMRSSLGDPSLLSRADVEFHLAIGRAGHNSILYRVLETLQHIMRSWVLATIEQDLEYWTSGEYLREHTLLYDAIRSRDVQAAREARAKGLDVGVRTLQAAIERRQP